MKSDQGQQKQILELAASMDAETLPGLVAALSAQLRERGLEHDSDSQKEPHPARMFIVPEGVRYLDTRQLATLTKAIDWWAGQAQKPLLRHSRQRVRLIYLMLRHSGAKVGEVLALDDTRDLDFEAGEIIFRGAAPAEPDRRVMLPGDFMSEFRSFLDAPETVSLRGRLFRMDQGFLRRKLAEQAGRVSFSREFLNPTVLRHSRAVELLRQGVPLPVVQRLLGHASVVLTSGYYAFSESDSKRILNHHIQKMSALKTSARNTFHGAVVQVRPGTMLTEVVLRTKSGMEIKSIITNESATNLGIAKGRLITAIIKAPFVMASHDAEACFAGPLNCFAATVTSIQTDGAYLEVRGALADGTTMCALIPYASPQATPLKVGGAAWFSFRALSVILIAD